MTSSHDTPSSGFALLKCLALAAASLCAAPGVVAQHSDLPDAQDHPLISRYPGQALRWQRIDNHREFRLASGPVTGYRTIDDWIDLEGRVTRSHYVYSGTERSWEEIHLNYRDALLAAGFEIIASGASDDRRGTAVGSRQWLNIYLSVNPPGTQGEVTSIAAGTATEGGQGVLIAKRDRAAGTVHVLITTEQHADDYVGTLIDVIESRAARTGLVTVDPEAIGRDLQDKGRVVLDGLFFDFDAPTLTDASAPALAAIADYLRANPEQNYYVVGHTDSQGTLSYNLKLSRERAEAVVKALVGGHGIAADRLEGHGVGPLNPVYSNSSDAGRRSNRRVELVEKRN